jgi:hypothetical protein
VISGLVSAKAEIAMIALAKIKDSFLLMIPP